MAASAVVVVVLIAVGRTRAAIAPFAANRTNW